MNQYVIVSFLQKEFPQKFLQPGWPLHITIVRPFFSNKSGEEFIQALITICSQIKPMHTLGKSREMFGPNSNVPVTELENIPALQSLHDQIMSELRAWMEFRTPQYKTYRPHATDQATGGISVGEEVEIDSISLVELGSEERQVLSTINFQL
jgi:hypothetical protein